MRINEFIKEAKNRGIELHNYCFYQNDEMVAHGNFLPYDKDDYQVVYSLSKTITAIGILFLVQEHKLSLDDTLEKLFTEYTIDPSLKDVTVHHLLTMASGHEKEPVECLFSDDIIQAYLSTPVTAKPGSIFKYNSVNSFMLSAIITKVTNLSLIDYLTPLLFEPLNITCCEQFAMGNINTGGYGLRINVKDIARLGLFLLHDGEGLLEPQYVELLSTKHIDTPVDEKDESRLGYGYQVWMSRKGYRMDGAFGQYCYIIKETNTVLALTSGVNGTQKIHDLVFDVLLNDEEDTEETIASIQPPIGYATSLMGNVQNNKLYVLEDNALGIKSIRCLFDKQNDIILETKQGHLQLIAGHNSWYKQSADFEDPMTKEVEMPFYKNMAVSGCFANGYFRFEILYTNTPYHDTYIIHYNEDNILLEYHRNASFGKMDIIIPGYLK